MLRASYTVIKQFSDNYYSVTQLKHKKPEGCPALSKDDCNEFLGIKEDRENPDKKLKESLIRSRTRIFEIAMCNEWELFATFTIDPKKYDRFQLDLFYKDFSTYIKNLNCRHSLSIKYLLIPECHKDGAWHMHGLLMGVPNYYLRKFTLDEKLPIYIRKQLRKGRDVREWLSYRDRFGFNDIEPIRNKEACCKYIVKYITKDLDRSVKEVNAKVYYCSKGLNRPKTIYIGEDIERLQLPDFANVWLERKDFFTFAQALEYSSLQFYDSFISAGLDENTIERILAG